MRYKFKWQDVLPAEISPDNQTNLEATIHRAVALGINHIETARGYGSSEMQLGRVLPTLPRDKILVQTKIPPMAPAIPPMPTTEPTANRGNMSLASVKMFADQAWCAAQAMAMAATLILERKAGSMVSTV
jgi:aryl-alcohol dehydrogenase-like predicted oxidoreductase